MRSLIVLFIIYLCYFLYSDAQCPSIGMHSYVLVTITSNVSADGFQDLFDYYAKVSSSCGIEYKHEFHFGNKMKRTVVSQNVTLQSLGADLDLVYLSSMVNSTTIKQTDNGDLIHLVNSFLSDLDDQNSHPLSVITKKIITIMTDYVNVNITDLIPGNLKFDNAEAFIITPIHAAKKLFDPKFNICVKDAELLDQCSKAFCKSVLINFPSPAVPEISKANIYAATFHSDLWMLRAVALEYAKGHREVLSDLDIKRNFIKVHFAQGDKLPITLPWVGNVTEMFYQKCINSSLIETLGLTNYSLAKREISNSRDKFQPGVPCSEASPFYKTLVGDLANSSLANGSVVFIADECPNCLKEIMNSKLSIEPDFQIFFRIGSNSERNDIFATFVDPVHNRLNTSNLKFHADFIEKPIDIINATVVNKDFTPYTPLVFAKKYKYREAWSLAIDEFIVIIVLCMITAAGVGAFLYRVTRKIYIEQLAEVQDEYKEAKICLKKDENLRNDCLPWEVHIDRICIHQDFPLGEDKASIIYLGKLKGKAPICQWINFPEIKQFQDCAVAVRVPRRYDEEEEKQLFREINAMKILKTHDYIANLLGWFNKHNFACTIMELTHTNLLKYASQVRDSCEFETSSSSSSSSVSTLPFKQYLRMFIQICDAMMYVASKGLVHRNLSAKNVLLTTGLRAKISGFNYCSTVGDPDFERSKPAFYQLPLHWMATEAMEGRFTDRSDVWSFAMILYEVYSLGDVPFAGVRDNLLQKTIKSGNRPSKPEFASDEMFSIMTKCWHRYPERRPTFKELHTQFQIILERQYENPAFVFEHAE